MAYQRDITEDDQIFYDEDKLLRFTVYQGNPSTEAIQANDAVPQDIAGWSLSWTLRKTITGPVLIEKTTGLGDITITGTYDADPIANTQRAVVTLKDTDTYDPDASPPLSLKPGSYVHALKRLDADAETILTWGDFELMGSAGWE